MKRLHFYGSAVVCGVVAGLLWTHFENKNYVGRAEPGVTSPPLRPGDASSFTAPQAHDPEPAADVSSQEPTGWPQEPVIPPVGHVRQWAPAYLLADLEEPWRPTPEGLFLRTADLWAQEDFLNLSAARLRELIPLDDDLATLPDSTDLRDLIGADLPTLDDCRRALQDEHTKTLLENLLVVEATYSELCETPESERNRDQRAIIRRLKDQRDTAEDHLMRRLDATTTYRHWSLMSRLYNEWQR